MSNWRIRSPDRFPPEFLATVQAAYNDYLRSPNGESAKFKLLSRPTRNSVMNQADKFYCFRKCLRLYPMHPLSKIETMLEIKLQMLEVTNEWKLSVYIRNRLSNDALIEALAGN